MKHFTASLALICAFSACDSKKGGSGSPSPVGKDNSDNPKNLVGNPENQKDISLDSLTSGTTISVKTDFQGSRIFRFFLQKSGLFKQTRLSRSVSCNGDPGVSLTLNSYANGSVVTTSPLANLSSSTAVQLQPGDYAIVISKSSPVTCSALSIELGIRVELATDNPSAAGNSGGGNSPNSPVDPEANRILRRQLKDSAGLEFLAYVSKEEGCQPVIRRSMADMKRNAGNNVAQLDQPISMSVENSRMETKFNFNGQARNGTQEQIFYFSVISQTFYDPNWANDLKDALLLRSETVKISLSTDCYSDEIPFTQNIFAYGDLSYSEEKLPIKAAENAPDVQFTYGYSPATPSLKVDIGVDHAAILSDFYTTNKADITKLQWMLNHQSASWSYPISDWNSMDPAQLFSNQLHLDAGTLANRGVFHFFNGAVTFRVTNKTGTSKDYILDIGSLCQAAYSRADGPAFHNRVFHDLTHPEWNNAPSKDNKQGCAFIGKKWW